jgi:hypothetical protein
MPGVRDDDRRDGSQPVYDIARLIHPPHMRAAGREKAMGWHPMRLFLQRSQQHRLRVLQAPGEKVSDPDRQQIVSDPDRQQIM